MRITVLTGGTSSERDVALASAVQVIGALRSGGHDVAVVDTARGYIPERDEKALLSGGVGTEPPPIDQLRGLEQGLLLSGLANLAVVRDADVLFLALTAAAEKTGPSRRYWRWWVCPTPAVGASAVPWQWIRTSPNGCSERQAWPPPIG
jgi:D-alanine-D-alanine ligase-like ATP-grasp enzyme